ncbi:putative membrane protein [Sulfurospirillum diekertiae]|uniref:Protoporphyrinogen IX oxidase n=1 Tax=Sulfurospirillum diekertiae TaxID=1854492 RepID=A0A290HCK6_9BACT|nr:CopD family protein [Sulfurospirillum diekertiae]ATB69187.1 putative membrane protein [Sulfurospirillum diekertiae]
MNYSYILGFHIMAMMSWMAVMFYLPRLYVYHKENMHNVGFVAVVKVQEYKLYKYIGLPSFWATISSGAVLIYLNPSLLEQPWMIAKLGVLVLLSVYSFSMEHYRLTLEQKKCAHNGQFFRAYNEVPTLLSILIVGYVIAKDTLPYFSVAVILFFGVIIYKIATLAENPEVDIKEAK